MTQLAQPAPAAGVPASDPLAGSRYRVLRTLGQGGSGVVYEAEHVDLRRRFAVKVLLPAHAKDRMTAERMRVEAQALGHLRSRHIVEVSDFGHTDDGRPFFVMPLLEGRTLLQEVRSRGCLPPAEAVALVQQLLAGLEVAHRAGLVHRDIKLDNLFLCDDDGGGERLIKILDFSTTKVLPGATGPEPPGLQTREGCVVGTPRFMAPEQAMGRDVGPPTDVYGAGAALYELLTGRDPFKHVTGFAPLLRAHVQEDAPAPSTVAPQPIEPVLDDVVMRALAKRPGDRYASAAELSAALTRAMEWSRNVGAGPSPVTSGDSAQVPAPVDQGARLSTIRPRAPSGPRGASVLVTCVLVLLSAALSALVAAAFIRQP